MDPGNWELAGRKRESTTRNWELVSREEDSAEGLGL